jgi:ABC-type lipoprotein export system ATPase subunit
MGPIRVGKTSLFTCIQGLTEGQAISLDSQTKNIKKHSFTVLNNNTVGQVYTGFTV